MSLGSASKMERCACGRITGTVFSGADSCLSEPLVDNPKVLEDRGDELEELGPGRGLSLEPTAAENDIRAAPARLASASTLDAAEMEDLGDELEELDPYRVLGLEPTATMDDIGAAHARLTSDSTLEGTAMEAITKAFEKLQDSTYRKAHAHLRPSLQDIYSGLQAYSQGPSPSAFIMVSFAVYAICNKCLKASGAQMLERTARSEVTRCVRQMGEALRCTATCSMLSWMNRVFMVFRKVRNRLYCLQAAFAYAEKSQEELRVVKTLQIAMQRANIEELADLFWGKVAVAVQSDEVCPVCLRDLVVIWSRCGCPVTPLRVPLTVYGRAFDALRLAVPTLPTMRALMRCHIQNNATLLLLMIDFLAVDDLCKIFGLGRSNWKVDRTVGSHAGLLLPVHRLCSKTRPEVLGRQ